MYSLFCESLQVVFEEKGKHEWTATRNEERNLQDRAEVAGENPGFTRGAECARDAKTKSPRRE
jgi:hypothetical protein